MWGKHAELDNVDDTLAVAVSDMGAGSVANLHRLSHTLTTERMQQRHVDAWQGHANGTGVLASYETGRDVAANMHMLDHFEIPRVHMWRKQCADRREREFNRY